jgi:hypothetical protein
MLNELTIAESILLHCQDLKKYYDNKEFNDDCLLLTGIICGLLISLNKYNPERIKSDLIKYSIEIVDEILEKDKI